jgi:hypothetical protein
MRFRSRRRPQVFRQMNRLSALLAQWHDPWVHRLQSKASLGSSHSQSAWREGLRMTASMGTCLSSHFGHVKVLDFMVAPVCCVERVKPWHDMAVRIVIRGRGVTGVRARAQTNFYPCRARTPCTSCSMRARRTDRPSRCTQDLIRCHRARLVQSGRR